MRSESKVRPLRALQRWLSGPQKGLPERYPQFKIGPGTYGGLTVLEWGEGRALSIGSYTSIGTEVTVFLGGEHRTDWVTTYPFSALWGCAAGLPGHPASKGDVVIGSDVWIANGASILSGVAIGDGAVVGTRAVVAKDVPAYAIVAGNPAKIVKFRFDEGTVARLLKISWWRWEPDRIAKAMPALLSSDIESFLSAAESGRI